MTADERTTIGSDGRIVSVDALRGLVIFTMIYVNDLAGAPSEIVPAWMRHYSGPNGMTFVDLVFPSFLFIVGMSIPLALGSRLGRGEPVWKCFGHVVVRALSLLFVGVMMVNGSPDAEAMGWSGVLWRTLMFVAAILAFSSLGRGRKAERSADRERILRRVTVVLRVLGLASLVLLALAFRGEDGQRIVRLRPFSVHTEWYGILGLIGWAYLVAAIVFLVFRGRRTALLGCVVLLLCLYPADRTGAFEGFWLSRVVGIGGTLGALGSIAAAGVLLGSVLRAPEITSTGGRARFALLFVAGCAVGAWLLNGLYGINKNNTAPSWCLWTCAITGGLWLLFHLLVDIRPHGLLAKLCRPLATAGSNVLLAYLISEMLPSARGLLGLDGWYYRLAAPGLAYAMARSIGCALAILAVTAGLNRVGFRLRL